MQQFAKQKSIFDGDESQLSITTLVKINIIYTWSLLTTISIFVLATNLSPENSEPEQELFKRKSQGRQCTNNK